MYSIFSIENFDANKKITQTQALEQFQLKYYQLPKHVEKRKNPHNERFAPTKLYSTGDLAKAALDVHGPTGENNRIQRERDYNKRRREEASYEVARSQARAAERVRPQTAAEQLCVEQGLAPWSKVPKTKAMERFGLEYYDLNGASYEERVSGCKSMKVSLWWNLGNFYLYLCIHTSKSKSFLLGVQENPRNKHWSSMKLYTAGDVAQAALKKRRRSGWD